MGRRKPRQARREEPPARPPQPRAARIRWTGRRWALLAVVGAGAVLGWTLAGRANRQASKTPVFGYEVVNVYPHDPDAFSQGLAFADGFLYEGTGRYRRSSLRQVDLESGKVVKHAPLEPRLFGEGITIWGDRIVQLTWRSRVGFVYDRHSFKRLGQFHYRGEGWGITHDGRRLVLSDGSATLRFLDPKTFRVVDTVTVRDGNRRVDQLNELEYVEGEIYANVWGSERIARISPADGRVVGWIDLAGLLKPAERTNVDAVLNGIAYDPKAKRLFVTGKLWPKLFEIRLVPQG